MRTLDMVGMVGMVYLNRFLSLLICSTLTLHHFNSENCPIRSLSEVNKARSDRTLLGAPLRTTSKNATRNKGHRYERSKNTTNSLALEALEALNRGRADSPDVPSAAQPRHDRAPAIRHVSAAQVVPKTASLSTSWIEALYSSLYAHFVSWRIKGGSGTIHLYRSSQKGAGTLKGRATGFERTKEGFKLQTPLPHRKNPLCGAKLVMFVLGEIGLGACSGMGGRLHHQNSKNVDWSY